MKGQTQQTGFDSGLQTVKTCGLCEKHETEIAMSFPVWNNIVAMCSHMGGTEWLGYLIGSFDEEADLYVVRDMVIPEQRVSFGAVEDIQPVPETDVIGTVHSHGSMGTFFSGTDDDFIGSNHDVMIVVSSGTKTKQQVRKLLPCGAYINVEVDCIQLYDPDDDAAIAFVAANKGKLTWIVYKSWADRNRGNGGNYVNRGGVVEEETADDGFEFDDDADPDMPSYDPAYYGM